MTEQTNRQFVRKEIRRISNASTTEKRLAHEEALENYIVSIQQENERLREAHLEQISETDYCYVCGRHGYQHDGTSDCPIDVAPLTGCE